MERYISKSAIVAEIERIKKEECPIDTYEGRIKLFYFERFLSFIDTLEVKEVDLNAAVERYVEQHKSELNGYFDIRRIARHFFELGLNIQCKISYVPNIDDILKKESINPDSKEAKIFKESYYIALEKLKSQRGE